MKFKLLPIVFCLSLSISAMANRSRPGYQRSSRIVKELLRQEKLVRANKPVDRRMDTRTKDYLRRIVTNMRITLNQFRSYIYKYKNDSNARDYYAIMDLFTICATENRNVTERKLVEDLLGRLIRLDTTEGEQFLIKPRDLLRAVEEWSMEEIRELRNMLAEVENASTSGLTENDAFLSILGNAKEEILRSCR